MCMRYLIIGSAERATGIGLAYCFRHFMDGCTYAVHDSQMSLADGISSDTAGWLGAVFSSQWIVIKPVLIFEINVVQHEPPVNSWYPTVSCRTDLVAAAMAAEPWHDLCPYRDPCPYRHLCMPLVPLQRSMPVQRSPTIAPTEITYQFKSSRLD